MPPRSRARPTRATRPGGGRRGPRAASLPVVGSGAGTVVARRYELVSLAGAGGMGAVWRARDRSARGRAVAVKLLHGETGTSPREAKRFAREARLLAELDHPGIVGYVDHGLTASGVPFLVMDWIEGESLTARMRRELSPGDAVEVVRRAAEAVGFAHARGVVHRDLKPTNIVLEDGDPSRVRVVDFGVASWVRATPGLTLRGMAPGTPGYMSPEQARGEPVDARADVFALGCVLFECLARRPVFTAEEPLALLFKVVVEAAPSLAELVPGLPPALCEVVAAALAKEAARRPADGADLARRLSLLEPQLAAMPVARSPARRPSPRRGGTRATPPRGGAARTAAAAREEPSAREADSITGEELRVLSVVAATGGAELGGPRALREVVERFGARLDVLADGALVAVLSGARSPADQAAVAARCALALRDELQRAADVARVAPPGLALATGRAATGGRAPVGDAIDRASALLRAAWPGVVRVDDVTAGLLGAQFEVGEAAPGAAARLAPARAKPRGRAPAPTPPPAPAPTPSESGLLLLAERDFAEAARTLLQRPTPCVGRAVELRMLEALFGECAAGPVARAVLVIGAPGIGKSRLGHELVQRLRDRGDPVEVWLARGDPMAAGSPFGLAAQAIRHAAGVLAGEAPEVRRRRLRARVARHVAPDDLARVTAFLGELVGASSADAEGPVQEARRDPVLMADQISRAVEDLAAAVSADQPILLVLEDLHWGDRATVDLVDRLLRKLAERPLLVLAFGRPEVLEQFPSLWAERGVLQLRLGGLPPRAAEELVRAVLGEEAAARPQHVQRLVERAGGNAFFLEELVRAAAEGRWDETPETVTAMLQPRLEALPSEARRVLRAASVFGRVFWWGGVQALLGGPEQTDDLDDRLRDLVTRELVSRRTPARFRDEREYAFRHALLRDAAYSTLTYDDCRTGHRLAGAWLERAGETDPLVLAEHHERGGASVEAAACFLRAGREALERNDLPAALDRVQRGVGARALGETLGQLLLVRAEALIHTGRMADARGAAADAAALLPSGTEGWYLAARAHCIAATALGHTDELVALAARVRASPPASGQSSARVGVLAVLAGNLSVQGPPGVGLAVLAEAEEAARDLTLRPVDQARLQQGRARRSVLQGDLVGAIAASETAIAALDRIGQTRGASLLRHDIAFLRLELGQLTDAEAALRALIDVGERAGLPNLAATARQNLALALVRQGRAREALAHVDRALEHYERHPNIRQGGSARITRAHVLRVLGDLAGAEEEATRAVNQLDGRPALRPYALATRAQIRLAAGTPGAARSDAAEANLGVDAGVEGGESCIRLMEAEVLEALGDRAGARAAIQRARDRLLARAEGLRDPDVRRAFLENVPDHARTLELAAALSA